MEKQYAHISASNFITAPASHTIIKIFAASGTICLPDNDADAESDCTSSFNTAPVNALPVTAVSCIFESAVLLSSEFTLEEFTFAESASAEIILFAVIFSFPLLSIPGTLKFIREKFDGSRAGTSRLIATASQTTYFHLAVNLFFNKTDKPSTRKITTAEIILSFKICNANSAITYSSFSSNSFRKSLRSCISSELIFFP